MRYLFLFLLCFGLQAQEKPNILFLFADDFAWDAVAFNGNKEVKTPHLDLLASQGTVFTHAYNSGSWSGAVCVASRAMMMTGQQVWNAFPIWRTGLSQYATDGKYWPQIMQKAGYQTYYAGKWHTGNRELAKKMWQNTRHLRPGMPLDTKEGYTRKFDGSKENWTPTDTLKGGFWQGGKHWSEVAVDDFEYFMQQQKKSDKPFLMTIAFNAPHDPRQAPQKFQDLYPYGDVQVPKSFQKLYPYDNGALYLRDEKLAPFPRTKRSIRVNRSEYYALITHLDEQIGRILYALKKSGMADNTIVFFTADHGLSVGRHGLLGKQNMYDHSVRVPWIIKGKGIPKGKRIDTPIYLQDVVATSLDLAHIKKPKEMQFNSVLPLLKGAKKASDVYGCYLNFQRMIVHDHYKLIVYPLIDQSLLYDLSKDPKELKDLSKDPKYRQTMTKLTTLLKKKMKAMNDPITLESAEEYKWGGL